MNKDERAAIGSALVAMAHRITALESELEGLKKDIDLIKYFMAGVIDIGGTQSDT